MEPFALGHHGIARGHMAWDTQICAFCDRILNVLCDPCPSESFLSLCKAETGPLHPCIPRIFKIDAHSPISLRLQTPPSLTNDMSI